jgi:hypothetical protein
MKEHESIESGTKRLRKLQLKIVEAFKIKQLQWIGHVKGKDKIRVSRMAVQFQRKAKRHNTAQINTV